MAMTGCLYDICHNIGTPAPLCSKPDRSVERHIFGPDLRCLKCGRLHPSCLEDDALNEDEMRECEGFGIEQ